MPRWRNEGAFDAEIQAAHQATGVPVLILRALIGIESGYNPRAYLAEAGGDGSVGLVQIRPSTAASVGFRGSRDALFVPATNILYGARYLMKLVNTVPNGSSDWPAVLSAYNGDYRPHLGFGARVTRRTTVCLRRDPVTSKCVRTYTAQPGEFGNQPYVDKFLAALRYFGGAGGGGGPGFLMLLAVGAIALAARSRRSR